MDKPWPSVLKDDFIYDEIVSETQFNEHSKAINAINAAFETISATIPLSATEPVPAQAVGDMWFEEMGTVDYGDMGVYLNVLVQDEEPLIPSPEEVWYDT